MREGYGPNVAAIRQLADRGASVLVTADCGTSAVAEIAEANALGMDALVLDHHTIPLNFPNGGVADTLTQLGVVGCARRSVDGAVFGHGDGACRDHGDAERRVRIPDDACERELLVTRATLITC